MGHAAADEPAKSPHHDAEHRVEEQCPLEVLQQERVEISAPTALEVGDGPIIEPEDILLMTPPRHIVHQEDRTAPQNGANQQGPDRRNRPLAPVAGAIARGQARDESHTDEERANVGVRRIPWNSSRMTPA